MVQNGRKVTGDVLSREYQLRLRRNDICPADHEVWQYKNHSSSSAYGYESCDMSLLSVVGDIPGPYAFVNSGLGAGSAMSNTSGQVGP